MVEFIDYEKRLTCEDHIVLWYYFHIYVDPEKDYRSFRITEELINAYNAPSNRSRREEIFRITERMKKELDAGGPDITREYGSTRNLSYGRTGKRRIII